MEWSAAEFLKLPDAVRREIKILINQRAGDIVVTVHDDRFAVDL
jgi:hypothetical protein